MIVSGNRENYRLSSKVLLEFYIQLEQLDLAVNSFMLLQNGKIISQFWKKPYRKDTEQLLFSLSKSFTSIAVGIAWDHGYLDLQDKVILYFPDKLPDTISTNLEKMTIHHLLSMNTGHHDNIYGSVVSEVDWVKAFLSLEVLHEPGSHYLYNTHATYMLSAIVERITGKNLVEFLMPRLFEPLGIPKPSWETCPMGITAGGMGLSIHTESIAKFGQMLLNKGMYDGKRIVSEEYINLATNEQSDNRKNADKKDFAQGYGYQFHLLKNGAFRGDGAFGQLCFVAPKERLVIVATSSFKENKQLQTLLELIHESILGKLETDDSQHNESIGILEHRLSSMTLFPEVYSMPGEVTNIHGCIFEMDENPHHLKKLSFQTKGEQLVAQFCYKDGIKDIPFHFKQPVHARDLFIKDLSQHQQAVVTYACWTNKSTLKLTLVYIETPYVITYKIKFDDLYLKLHFNMNVSLSLVKEFKVSGKQNDSKVS